MYIASFVPGIRHFLLFVSILKFTLPPPSSFVSHLGGSGGGADGGGHEDGKGGELHDGGVGGREGGCVCGGEGEGEGERAARVCRSRRWNSTTEEVRAPPFGSGCRPAMPPTPHPAARPAGAPIASLEKGWRGAGPGLLTPCGGRPVSVPSIDSRGARCAHAPCPRRVAAPPTVLPLWPKPRTHPGGRKTCQASHWAQERGTGWGGSAVPRRRRFSFASERARARAPMHSVPSPPPAPRPPALPLFPPARPPHKGQGQDRAHASGG